MDVNLLKRVMRLAQMAFEKDEHAIIKLGDIAYFCQDKSYQAKEIKDYLYRNKIGYWLSEDEWYDLTKEECDEQIAKLER